MQSIRTHFLAGRPRLLAWRNFEPRRIYSSPISYSGSRLNSNLASDEVALTNGEKAISGKLKDAFPGGNVVVKDVSGGCGSFYAVSLTHPEFKGLGTVARHRRVNEILKDEISQMHGLQLNVQAE